MWASKVLLPLPCYPCHQVLYLDMGIAGPPEEPIHQQIAATLGVLPRLGILSLGACYLQVRCRSHTCSHSLLALRMLGSVLGGVFELPSPAGSF